MAAKQRGDDLRAVESLVRRLDEVSAAAELAKNQETRAYIGASSIGNPCQAYLALSLRGFGSTNPDPQLSRIFNEGHRIETFVVEMLAAAGIKLKEIDPATGKQYHYDTMGGHIAANLDGLVWRGAGGTAGPASCTLEIKSMNGAMFKRFQARGLAVSHPHYIDQMMTGMGLSGIHSGLIVAYCKDNSKFDAEIVHFDEARYKELIANSVGAMFAAKAVKNESFECTRCFKSAACRTGLTMTKTAHCRQCRHAMPDITQPGKKWICKLHNRNDVELPCSDFAAYQLIKVKP